MNNAPLLTIYVTDSTPQWVLDMLPHKHENFIPVKPMTENEKKLLGKRLRGKLINGKVEIK